MYFVVLSLSSSMQDLQSSLQSAACGMQMLSCSLQTVSTFGIQLLDQGLNLGPLHREGRLLTTGPPGKSLGTSFFQEWSWKGDSDSFCSFLLLLLQTFIFFIVHCNLEVASSLQWDRVTFAKWMASALSLGGIHTRDGC